MKRTKPIESNEPVMPSDKGESSAEEKAAVAVYGLSSEGYGIAARLASKGFKVSFIDESLGTALELRPEIAGDYRELRELLSDEIPMPIRSSKECISSSKVVFFTPKIRRVDEDILAEVKSRISDACKHLSQGTLFIFCLPLGIAQTKEILDRIEHVCGMRSGKDFRFGYAPIEGGHPTVFGCEGNITEYTSIVEAAGFSMELFSLAKAELVHMQRLVSRYSMLASTFESAKRLVQLGYDCPREYKQTYADDLSASLYDLKLTSESLENGDHIMYLVSGSLRIIESYTRFLVDRIREFVRTRELKAARLKIILFSDNDQLEMRGDKISFARNVQEKLRDFYADIDSLNIMKEGFTLPTGMDKTNLLVFLSGSSEQRLLQLYEEQISMAKSYMIRANLPVEFVVGPS